MGEGDVGGLIAALGDEDSWVRWHAADALGKIGDPRAIPALEKAINACKVLGLKFATALNILSVMHATGRISGEGVLVNRIAER